MRSSRAFKILVWLVVAGALVFVAIQFVPYGRAHENPPVTQTPTWDSPRTEELLRESCYDCHSNETRWPWYSNIAPSSWLLTRDIDDGREAMNFSEWEFTEQQEEGAAVAIELTVREGDMPPSRYLLLHPGARLSDEEKQELIDGVNASLGQ
jgi:hypothetical protein